jgi:hypothetical protein
VPPASDISKIRRPLGATSMTSTSSGAACEKFSRLTVSLVTNPGSPAI